MYVCVCDMYICAMACMSRSEHSFTELVLSFALLWILRMNIGPRVYIWSSASVYLLTHLTGLPGFFCLSVWSFVFVFYLVGF